MYDFLRDLSTTVDPPAPVVDDSELMSQDLQPAGNGAMCESLAETPFVGGMLCDIWSDIDQAVNPNTVYIGTNTPVVEGETGALPSWAAIADGTKDGKVKSMDGKSDLSLQKPEEIRAFLQDAGVGAARQKPDGSTETPAEVEARMAALQKVLGSSGTQSRDNLAELVQTVQRAENGEIDMERIVISGHHHRGATDIHGDSTLTYDQLQSIMEQFPTARGNVKDLMFSACNTKNGTGEDAIYRKIFPNLESAWGYDGIAPSIGPDPKNSSPAHIAAWEEATRGNDPEKVKEGAKGKTAVRVATY